jgi:N-acetylmuramoyl-L-alanine amidase
VTAAAPERPAAPRTGLYRVQAGAFLRRENAEERAAQLRAAGFDAYILHAENLYKVQVGAFTDRANAERLAERLRAVGYETIIVRQ